MYRPLLVGLIVLILSGCQGYLQLIDGLNERQVESCLDYSGTARLGGGIFAGGQGGLRGITATGGATLEDCRALLRE